MPWFSLFMRLMLFVFAEDASRICQRVLPAGCYPPVNKTLVPLFGTRVWFVARVMLFVFEEDTSRNRQRVLPAGCYLLGATHLCRCLFGFSFCGCFAFDYFAFDYFTLCCFTFGYFAFNRCFFDFRNLKNDTAV